MPESYEEYYGGHAISICGYDVSSDNFIFRNSWGASWGMKGYGVIPSRYVLHPDLAADFWTLRQTS